MEQYIKNAEEQQQQPQPAIESSQLIPQPQSTIPLSLQSVKRYKSQYIIPLFLLLEIILSIAIFVLLTTLDYSGFGWAEGSSKTDKIFFQGQNCQDLYLLIVSKFIGITIRSAFIFLCIEMFISFLNVVLGFVWSIKVAQKHNGSNKIYKLRSLRKDCRIMNILIPICIVLTVLIFGIYLYFTVLGDRTADNAQCHFSVLNKEVIPIATLLAVKLALYLLIWLIVICATYEVINLIEFEYSKAVARIFPSIKESPSIPVGQQIVIRKMQRESNKIQKNSRQIVSEQEQFKSLKTEDFLLQLKNNSKHQPTSQDAFKIDELKIQSQKVQSEQEDQSSNRRMMVYKPLESQKFISDQNLSLPILPKDQPKLPKRQKSVEDFSVKNSLEKQKDRNHQLLINSVQRSKNIDKVSSLPLNSKKKPSPKKKPQKEPQPNTRTQKVIISSDSIRILPPKETNRQQRQPQEKQQQKPQVKSIIMKLDNLSERSRKELNTINTSQKN